MPQDNGHTNRDIWLKHAHARHALSVVLPALERGGIEVVLVKGVALEATLYGDTAKRPISDVDLRVQRTQFAALCTLVERERWRVQSRYDVYGSVCVDIEGMPVDIESHIGPPHLCRLGVRDLLAHGARTAIGQTYAMIPDVVDHALLVVVNLFKDKITTAMPWALGDLAMLVGHPNFESSLFVERAQRYRMTLMCKLVLEQLAARSQAPELLQLATRLSPPPWYNSYAQAYVQTSQAPHRLPARLIARLGSDAAVDWPKALWWAARLTFET